jgi:hypothetical protein
MNLKRSDIALSLTVRKVRSVGTNVANRPAQLWRIVATAHW